MILKRVAGLILALLLGIHAGQVSAQSPQSALGQWSDHISFADTRFIAQSADKVYASNEEGVFIYNRKDNSLSRLTRVQGLTQRGISNIAWNSQEKLLVIGYSDGNIDLWDGNSVYNMPDLVNSSVLGSKRINRIVSRGKYAYFCTGVGVLKVDLEKKEVSETFNLVVPGQSLIINDIDFFNDSIYAATVNGLYAASQASSNLGNFQLWNKLALPAGNYQQVEQQSTGIYTLYRSEENGDSLFYKEQNTSWSGVYGESDVRKITRSSAGLLLLKAFRITVLDGEDIIEEMVPPGINRIDFRDIVLGEEGHFWVGDFNNGIVELTAGGEVLNVLRPEGPSSPTCFELTVNEGDLWMVTGRVNRPGNWNNDYSVGGYSKMSGGEWINGNWNTEMSLEDKDIRDMVDIAVDPDDPDHAFIGSWYSGLVEVENQQLVDLYDYTNSPLQEWIDFGEWTGVSDVEFDEEGNLWMLNGHSSKPLVVRSPEGDWKTLDFRGELGSSRIFTDLLLTRGGDKWVVYKDNGVLVYSDNETPFDDSDDKARMLSSQTGQGGLHTTEVQCIEQGLDDEIWVGTAEGISVFFTPGDVFSERPSDAQRIIIESGEGFRYLLEAESITSIAVDGANRKWVGTESSGAYLLADDGKEQLRHFTTKNSPLPSDFIEDIEIDEETGEVYFGTRNGIVSYRGEATVGKSQNNCATVHPNPVRENYKGPIALDGLVRDAIVKITDLRGNLVKELTSKGGQAVWNGTDQDGNRVHTGVYFALASSALGETACVSKILVIK